MTPVRSTFLHISATWLEQKTMSAPCRHTNLPSASQGTARYQHKNIELCTGIMTL